MDLGAVIYNDSCSARVLFTSLWQIIAARALSTTPILFSFFILKFMTHTWITRNAHTREVWCATCSPIGSDGCNLTYAQWVHLPWDYFFNLTASHFFFKLSWLVGQAHSHYQKMRIFFYWEYLSPYFKKLVWYIVYSVWICQLSIVCDGQIMLGKNVAVKGQLFNPKKSWPLRDRWPLRGWPLREGAL